MKRNGMLAILIALIAMALGGAAAQQKPPEQKPPEPPRSVGVQEQSVAEAARKARQQKGAPAKATRVFTNDNLPSGPVNVVGGGGAPAGASGEAGAAGAEGAAAGEGGAAPNVGGEGSGVDEAEIQRLKDQLAVMKKDLDLLTRDFALRQQQFSGNPGYMRDTSGKAALDALEAQKNQLQQSVADAEARLRELEGRRRAAPAPSGPPSPEKQQQALLQKVQPLREELARVDAELTRIRAEAAKSGQTVYGSTASGGGFTADMITQMEKRRTELQRQIADLEDEARRAGARI